MALQVWLPLNGDLKNKGCADVTVTNNGATVNNNGKIGKCYDVTKTQYLEINNLPFSKLTNCSISLWLKVNSIGSSGWLPFAGSSTSYYILATSKGTGNFYHSTRNVGSNAKVYKDGVQTLVPGSIEEWHHYVITGLNLSTWTKFYINHYNSSWNFAGSINDIRIYDHCLSPKEVKEISQGLIMHYKLDINHQVLNNVFTNPTFNTSSAAGGWLHWAPSGSKGTYSQNTDANYIFNRNQTYSHKVSCTEGQYYICYQSPAFEGGYRSAQAIIKLPNGEVPDTSKIRWSGNALVIAPTTKFTHLRDGFYLMKAEGFNQNGSNDLVDIVILQGVTVYISEAYLENNKKLCSDIFNQNSNIECDSSGYGNHGTVTEDLLIDNDSPRYNSCIQNVSSYLLGSVFDFPESKGLTIAGWVYVETRGYQVSGLWTTSTSSTTNPNDYNQTTCSHTDTYFRMRGTDGNLYSITCNSTDIPLNTWKHVALTHNGTDIKLYIDGVLIRSISCPTSLVGFKSFWLGRANSNRYTQGKWSDFRIYCTALSAEDIRQLYEVSAKIDKEKNLHCYEFSELGDSNTKIFKTGVFRTGEFNEIDGIIKIKKDKTVDSNQFIET